MGIQPSTIRHLEQSPDPNKSVIEVWKDGWTVAMITGALIGHAVWEDIVVKKSFMLSTLSAKHNASEADLYMALRVLCGLGWLGQRELHGGKDVLFFHTPKSSYFFCYAPALLDVSKSGELWCKIEELNNRDWTPIEKMTGMRLQQSVQQERLKAKNENADAVQKYVALCAEACLIVPLLGMINDRITCQTTAHTLEGIEKSTSEQMYKFILSSFKTMSWVERIQDEWVLTSDGQFHLEHAHQYCETFGFLDKWAHFAQNAIPVEKDPTNALANFAKNRSKCSDESTYQTLVRSVLDHLKSSIPQPKGLCFAQCDDVSAVMAIASALKENNLGHLKVVISHEDPMVLSGFEKEASTYSDLEIITAESSSLCPELLNQAVNRLYGFDLKNMVHVHLNSASNRTYQTPQITTEALPSYPIGIYRQHDQRISAGQCLLSLIAFLKTWAPYFQNYGGIIEEMHIDLGMDERDYVPGSLHTAVASAMQGKFPVDAQNFEYAIKAAGLMSYSSEATSESGASIVRIVKS